MCTIRGTVSVPDASQPYSVVLLQGGEGIDTCRIEKGAFTLKTRQNPQVQQSIKLIDAEGNDVGDGGIYDMMEIVADTRSMSVNFDTQESSGSPLTAAMNDLIHELDKLDFKWIRILYMYPDEIEEDLLVTMKACKKVLPYFDIPIQYGNDAILKLMNRRGSVKLIREKIDLIRKYFDDAYIRTTLIVGFPHETKETFEDTMTLVKDIRFDSLGAFTYSPEEDTKAYEMDEQVDEELKQQRYDELMSLQQKIAEEKNQSRVGKTYEVLVERYESLFDRYVARSYMSAPDGIDGIIYIRSEDELQIGDFYEVEISGYKNYDLTAIMKKKR